MGEARRKKLLGNTEPSNLNWKRRPRKLTRKEEEELTKEVSAKMLSAMGLYPRLPMEMRSRKMGGLG